MNRAGLRYEVGLNIRTGNIVWVHGGVPCGDFPDLALARSRSIYCVNDDERTVADEGYRDARYLVYPSAFPLCARRLHQIMTRHETVNKRVKQFEVTIAVFRHNRTRHNFCFLSVVNIVQIQIENGTLFDDAITLNQK